MNTNLILNNEELKAKAPSIFTDAPNLNKVSSRYAFIPTTAVLDTLRSNGWLPVGAKQSRSNNPENTPFTRHMLRFRHVEHTSAAILGEAIPELICLNSHQGGTSFEFTLGIFRLVCLNGLVVSSGDLASYRIRHVGYTNAKVLDASAKILDQAPKVLANIQRFSSIELSATERLEFATNALTLKFPNGGAPIDPAQLLHLRRNADAGATLWNTLNVVQENIIRGGMPGVASTGRRTTTREVKAIPELIRLNQGVWSLAEAIAAR